MTTDSRVIMVARKVQELIEQNNALIGQINLMGATMIAFETILEHHGLLSEKVKAAVQVKLAEKMEKLKAAEPKIEPVETPPIVTP